MLNRKYINKCTLHYRMNNSSRVELRMPALMLKKVDRIADLSESTRSEVIRNAVRDYADKRLLMLGDKNDY